jgi:hypothetical protein
VYGPVADADARAAVFDNRSGAPISGVTVQLRKADGTSQTGTTDSTGVATFTGGGPAADIKDLSVFPASHNWVTYVAPAKNDLAFFVDPLVDSTKVTGAGGTFNLDRAQPPTGDIKLGLASFSIAGALSDINLAGLVGKIVPTDISIPSISVNQQDVPLPSGVFLKLANDNIKGEVDMFVDGPCPASDPCNRVLWGLGGQVSLAKIGPIIAEVTGNSTGDLDAGKILAAVLPFFRNFYHYAKGGFALTEITAPDDVDTIPAWTEYDNVSLTPNYPLAQEAKWRIPTLPELPTDSSKFTSGTLVLTGSLVPGQGTVPLGVSAGLDECSDPAAETCKLSGTDDGKVACTDDSSTESYDECEGLSAGDLVLDYAAPHDGLEGRKFVTVAIALDVNGLGAGSLFTSVLVSFTDTVDSANVNSFPIQSFLTFGKGVFNPDDRMFTGSGLATGADFYRLNLDTLGKPWLVFFNASTVPFEVEIPSLPTGVTDDRIDRADIQAFKLFTGTGYPSSLGQLAEFNSTNFDGLVNYTGGFSTNECAEVYPARSCSSNTTCAEDFDDNYTCDTSASLCVNSNAGVTVAGTGDCAAGTRKLYVSGISGPAVCSQVPACEID